MFSEKQLILIFSILLIGQMNCSHDKPKERSEEKWNKDFKRYCDESSYSEQEKEEQNFYDNCVNENDVSHIT